MVKWPIIAPNRHLDFRPSAETSGKEVSARGSASRPGASQLCPHRRSRLAARDKSSPWIEGDRGNPADEKPQIKCRIPAAGSGSGPARSPGSASDGASPEAAPAGYRGSSKPLAWLGAHSILEVVTPGVFPIALTETSDLPAGAQPALTALDRQLVDQSGRPRRKIKR